MECLHCGDCCRRMSPLSAPDPCPHIVETGSFVLCGVYECRPEECRKHSFPMKYCPVGLEILDIGVPEKAHRRIDDGYTLTKKLKKGGSLNEPDS